MKRWALIRELETAGCTLHRQGKRQDIDRNPANGRLPPVPRHTEVADSLYAIIRRQLSLPREGDA